MFETIFTLWQFCVELKEHCRHPLWLLAGCCEKLHSTRLCIYCACFILWLSLIRLQSGMMCTERDLFTLATSVSCHNNQTMTLCCAVNAHQMTTCMQNKIRIHTVLATCEIIIQKYRNSDVWPATDRLYVTTVSSSFADTTITWLHHWSTR